MLLARVADRIYWAARYVERAEDTARLVRAHSELMADLPPQIETRWEPLVAVTGSDVRFRDRNGHTQPSPPGRSPSRSQSQSQSQSQSSGGQSQSQSQGERPEDVEMSVARFLITDRNEPEQRGQQRDGGTGEPAHDA